MQTENHMKKNTSHAYIECISGIHFHVQSHAAKESSTVYLKIDACKVKMEGKMFKLFIRTNAGCWYYVLFWCGVARTRACLRACVCMGCKSY